MKFLREVNEDVKVTLVESVENGLPSRNYFLEGIFIQCDTKNRNGRIYPLDVVTREVDRYNNNMILTKRSMGELGHPENAGLNLERVSHLITELNQFGKDFIGKAKLMPSTPMGSIAIGLVQEGVQLGMSTRGFGSTVDRNGVKMVGNDFYLSTVDIVADPSAPQAFVNGIMENKEFYFENGILLEKNYEDIQKKVKNLTKTQITEGAILKLFDDFIKTLK